MVSSQFLTLCFLDRFSHTGLRDLCLECMQYQAEDRIDRAELSDWLAELHAQAEEEATNPLGK